MSEKLCERRGQFVPTVAPPSSHEFSPTSARAVREDVKSQGTEKGYDWGSRF